ncbi:hypothetical protein Pmani_038863 [Petrolisthes manimaculis]|uniref:Uncharacterized protein n=1 Tax=Petrolisthes manimaculis TaxID=1843537 RepID=A0AAE1TJV1_9EUCA|nr:hypothetical protein Pmani_038863 [Petrolisthes manimaculis]
MNQVNQSYRNIVYLNKTWVNQNDTIGKYWRATTSPPPATAGVTHPTAIGVDWTVMRRQDQVVAKNNTTPTKSKWTFHRHGELVYQRLERRSGVKKSQTVTDV